MFGCLVLVLLASMVANLHLEDHHSLCFFMRSLQSLKNYLWSSQQAFSILAVPVSMPTKVSASKEWVECLVWFASAWNCGSVVGSGFFWSIARGK